MKKLLRARIADLLCRFISLDIFSNRVRRKLFRLTIKSGLFNVV